MALTKTTKPSIIKTRAQARTEARTGPTVRTKDDTTAPVAVATGGRTTGRTIGPTDVAPVPVDDLFAGRPNTGALKDPPPVPVPVLTGTKQAPRDRDSDDAKKPTAKPKSKGRPKKVVAPKATRKPRVDANELVDPMSRVQVHDATGVVTAGGISRAGGGLARAGGNDPVLARLVDVPDGNGGGGGGGSGGGSESSEASSQTGSGNDESHHSDADSIADEDDGNPAVIPFEVPGAPPVIIGRTPAEQRFSQYLAGPPFDCTDKARRVLYFQQFKSWDAVRDKVPEDLPQVVFYYDHQEL